MGDGAFDDKAVPALEFGDRLAESVISLDLADLSGLGSIKRPFVSGIFGEIGGWFECFPGCSGWIRDAIEGEADA